MLLTISTTHRPATDLGYLLHKNPARVQEEELSFGKASVFYPEASDELCTAALLIEIDPVALVRGRGPAGEGGQMEQYVNDRPYAANSFPERGNGTGVQHGDERPQQGPAGAGGGRRSR